MKKYKIMFVCTGNICRSPLAHGVFEHLAKRAGLSDGFEVESSGVTAFHVGENVDSRMKETAAQYGISLNHRSQKTKKSDLKEYDLIFAMDRSNFSALRRMASENGEREKIRMFREFDPDGNESAEVPDPWYGGMNGFEKVFQIVHRTCEQLLHSLNERQAG